MMRRLINKGKKIYYCRVCKLGYKERGWAEKCENWCEKNKSCNLEITKHAIKIKEVKKHGA